MTIRDVDTRGVVWLRRLLQEETGQDLIEYGLLSAVIGIAGLVIYATFADRMQAAYINWNVDAQDVWEPCDPSIYGGACP